MAQIYKATYSGVPVYEFICNNVAVMRRRADSYLNATQILKVAEFDKPQRTRILEREVQTGQHEKVQGGYGKYQGTWVPFERGVALAQHYQVDNLLRPIFDFVKGEQSPPLAPKHVTAASNRPRKPRSTEPKRKKVIIKRFADPTSSLSMQPYPPQQSYADTPYSHDNYRFIMASGNKRSRQQFQADDENMDVDNIESRMNPDISMPFYMTAENSYAQQLLQYFISDDAAVIPPILLHPPSDLDVNVIIDDEGHTSLHWAAAMGRLQLVQILINLGADIYRVNYKGQTALMRSVLFTNNFDSKSFLFLIDILKDTIYNIDKKDQTVFHHVAATASWKGKVHASRYYMECLIDCMKQGDLTSILNVQDVYGDTALSIAARIGNKKLVRLLLEAGASAEIPNEEGMTAQDYIMEGERNNRFQPPLQPSAATGNSSPLSHLDSAHQQHQHFPSGHYKSEAEYRKELAARTRLRQNIEGLFKKILVNDRTQPSLASHLFDGFAGNYERELIQKDHILKEKRNELEVLRKRLAGTKHTFEQIQYDPSKVETVEKENGRLSNLLSKLLWKVQTERLRAVKEDCFKKLEEQEKEMVETSKEVETSQEDTVKSETSEMDIGLDNEKPTEDTTGAVASDSTVTATSGNSSPPNKKAKTTASNATGTESLELMCLLEELKGLREARKKRTEELESLIRQTPSKRHQEYKRLISMCCNVAYENVDLMLLPLLSSFDELLRSTSPSLQNQPLPPHPQQAHPSIPPSTHSTTATSTPSEAATVRLEQEPQQSIEKSSFAESSSTHIATVESQRHHQTEMVQTEE